MTEDVMAEIAAAREKYRTAPEDEARCDASHYLIEFKRMARQATRLAHLLGDAKRALMAERQRADRAHSDAIAAVNRSLDHRISHLEAAAAEVHIRMWPNIPRSTMAAALPIPAPLMVDGRLRPEWDQYPYWMVGMDNSWQMFSRSDGPFRFWGTDLQCYPMHIIHTSRGPVPVSLYWEPT